MVGKLLVTGSREFADERSLRAALEVLMPHAVIHGGAHGADNIAGKWANEQGRIALRDPVEELAFPVSPQEWQSFGRIAGAMRNARMLRESRPELVLATVGGNGTQDMITRALHAGVPVLRLVTLGDLI